MIPEKVESSIDFRTKCSLSKGKSHLIESFYEEIKCSILHYQVLLTKFLTGLHTNTSSHISYKYLVPVLPVAGAEVVARSRDVDKFVISSAV